MPGWLLESAHAAVNDCRAMCAPGDSDGSLTGSCSWHYWHADITLHLREAAFGFLLLRTWQL